VEYTQDTISVVVLVDSLLSVEVFGVALGTSFLEEYIEDQHSDDTQPELVS
jgi:hypothetical protein